MSKHTFEMGIYIPHFLAQDKANALKCALLSLLK